MKEVRSKQTIKTVVTKEVQDKMKYLCESISQVEWSGVLFYDIEGTIKDPENMVITIKNILPLDKGSTGYTEYVLDERLTNFLMDYPEHLPYKIGHIHSHHNMQVYFSGTDMEELLENAESHNYYFSIIVNNKMELVAKVGQVIETESKTYVRALDDNGEQYVYESIETGKSVLTYDCKITKEDVGIKDEIFLKNVSEILKPKPQPKSNFPAWGGQSNQTNLFDEKSVIDYGAGFTWANTDLNNTGVILDADEICIRLLTKKRVGSVLDKVTLEAILKEKDKSENLRSEAVHYFFLNLDVFLRDVTKVPVEEQNIEDYLEDLMFIRDTIEIYDEYKVAQQLVVNLEDIIEKLYKGK